jgi:hypothetical protein
MISLRRWRPRHLFLAWCAYWIGTVLVMLWPAIVAAWRLSQPGRHGNVSAGFGNGVLSATIRDGGQTLWAGSMSFLSLSLLLTIPPLILWLAWLASSSRMNNADETALNSRVRQRELQAKGSRIGIVDTSTSKRRSREEI